MIKSLIHGAGIGIDFSGIVTSSESERFRVGDRVFETQIPSLGTLSESVTLTEDSIELMPSNLNFSQSSVLPLASLTVVQAFRSVQLKAGRSVLVVGGSGGTGHIAIQIAKAQQASVTTVCSKKIMEFVQQFQPDHIVPYDDDQRDVISYLEERCQSQGKPFDLVYDTVTSSQSIDSAWNYPSRIQSNSHLFNPLSSRYLRLGGHTSDWLRAHLKRNIGWDFSSKDNREELFWVTLTGPQVREDLQLIKQYCEDGKLVPHVSHVYSFNETSIRQGFSELLSRRTRGKISVQVKEEE